MVIVIALASALCYGAAMVLQQHSAVATDPALSLRPGLVVDLARRPIWLAGVAANIAGFGLRFIALGLGSLVVVQPVLTTSILFALPLSAHWHRAPMSVREWLGAIGIVGGVCLFIVSAQPSRGHTDASGLAWLTAGAGIAALCAVLLMLARGRQGPWRAALLAGAGAVLLTSTAALTKVTAAELRDEQLHVLATWQPYALVAVTALALVVVQSAFGAAPLSASLPVLMVVELLAGVTLGVALFGEQFEGGVAPWTGALFGLAAMAVGLVFVASSAAVAGAPEGALTRPG